MLVPPHGKGPLRPLAVSKEELEAERRRAAMLRALRVSSREKGDLIMLGSRIGARLLHGMSSVMVRRIVISVLALAGARALARGVGIWP